jgi:KipI family sensor histidine kinase inhibitor
MSITPRILTAGDCALVVEFGDAIDPGLNREVRELWRAIEHAGTRCIVEMVPTYRSLLVYYDPLQLPAGAGAGKAEGVEWLKDRLLEINEHKSEGEVEEPRVVELPTVYGGEFGPDLGFVASHNGLTEAEVIEIHSSTSYLVYMMGFSPGFPYLGGMSPRIAAPRLHTPRTAIPAGSVGIAGEQTGVYPVESPGGWRLIGRTNVRLFDVHRDPPFLVEAGDYIRFVPNARCKM